MQILDGRHWVLERTFGSTVIRLRRTRTPFAEVAELEASLDAFGALMPAAERAPYALLLDLRDGPMRNDPEFEQVFRDRQRQLFGGFRRVALLVRTAVGKLQVNRQARAMGKRAAIFDDEQEALAHLRAK